MASTEGLVPITRAFLASFYDKFPLRPLPSDVSSLDSLLQERYEFMAKQYAAQTGNSGVVESLVFESPHKIDENFWKNREQTEEIMFLLDSKQWPSTLKKQSETTLKSVADVVSTSMIELAGLLKRIEEYQAASSEKIFSMILTYMPQDFRSTLIKQQRERSEKRRQLEVENLVIQGGSIRDKYTLLWRQQMERRDQLVMLGAASGVYKTLLRFLVGVPQVLLDFVQKINDHNGPMEEQRQRYGPVLYQLTQFALHIRIFVDLWWKTFDYPTISASENAVLLKESVKTYTTELIRFLNFLSEVFDKSPFLISAEEAGAVEGRASDYKETVVLAGKSHEVVLNVDSEGCFVAWDFNLTSGKDIGFMIEYISSDGVKTLMFPYQRCESHQGSFSAPNVGLYRLVWDNSYSTFFKKYLRYKVDAIPPVADPQKPLEDSS